MALDLVTDALPAAVEQDQHHLALLTVATLGLLATLGLRRIDGLGGGPDWLAAVQEVLLTEHLAAAALAVGGWDGLDRATLRLVARRVEAQFGYLDAFLAARPAADWGPRDLARLAQYGDGAVRGTFSAVTRVQAGKRGATQERNVLGSERSCSECPSLTARGWVPLGSLPEIGSRQCHGNDHCTIVVR